jgi:hypothetical protein
MRFAAASLVIAMHREMRDPKTMPPRRNLFVDREPATTVPLFKFLLVVGVALTIGLIAIGSSYEQSAAVELSAKKRTSVSLEAKK